MVRSRNVSGFLLLSLTFSWCVAISATATAGEAGWRAEWERTLKAAEKEGQVVVYALSEVGEVFSHGDFQRKFPRIKVSVVSARGNELVSRIMAERRADKFLVDAVSMGNVSPQALYQGKALDPITAAFIVPEVKDESLWWGGKYQMIDPEKRYIILFTAAPIYVVAYNTKLVNPSEFKSYWDLLNPHWKNKIAAFDLRSGGFAGIRDRFFYYNPELGPTFLKRLYSEMNVTFYRQYPQGEDWLAAGKFALCLCRHQSINEAKTQGLPVDLIDPHSFKEGVGVESRARSLALTNKAPHPNAARVFTNWLLSREGQEDFQKLSAQYVSSGAAGSLRLDVPKDGIPPGNKLILGKKYRPDWPELADITPVRKLFDEALAEAAKR
jgi:iron(III) transport system substrate-binding protein